MLMTIIAALHHKRICCCLSLLGHMAACTAITLHSQLHVRCLQLWRFSIYRPNQDHLDTRVIVPKTIVASLTWWTSPSKVMTGTPFILPTLQATIPCRLGSPSGPSHSTGNLDATRGQDSYKRAGTEGSPFCMPGISSHHRVLLSSNIASVLYINQQDGARSLTHFSKSIHLQNWCIKHHMML